MKDMEMVSEAGANKVSMDSAAVKDPALMRQTTERFGAEKVTIAVDARKNKKMPSGFELIVSGVIKLVFQDAIAWAKQCCKLDAGAIMLNQKGNGQWAKTHRSMKIDILTGL